MQFRKALAVVLLATLSQSASAIDISSNYGVIQGIGILPDTVRNAEYGTGVHLIYGVPLMDDLDLEINGFSYLTQRETSNNDDFGYGGGLDLRYNLVDTRIFGLFFLGGAGALFEDIETQRGVSPYADVGFSLNFWDIFGIQNLSLRSDARYYHVFRENSSGYSNPVLTSQNLGDARVHVGFQLDFSGPVAPKSTGLSDKDSDGVIDSRDMCPDTPVGTEINGEGCPLSMEDSDGDGINDSEDKCPNTAPGTAVDPVGCAIAGVAPVPAAPAAAAGAIAVDSDGDGVTDTNDLCPNSPAGLEVDARGCTLTRDQDNDGVSNSVDRCPNTPSGMRVDERGCVVRQVVVFNNINFETASDKLTLNAKNALNGMVSGLQGQPGMHVEISGHTDSQGDAAYNLKLSQKRALSVKAYLMSRGIAGTRMHSEGYGEYNPVASNDTENGRAENRRVEFKVLRQ